MLHERMEPANFGTELLPIEGLKSKDPTREKSKPNKKTRIAIEHFFRGYLLVLSFFPVGIFESFIVFYSIWKPLPQLGFLCPTITLLALTITFMLLRLKLVSSSNYCVILFVVGDRDERKEQQYCKEVECVHRKCSLRTDNHATETDPLRHVYGQGRGR